MNGSVRVEIRESRGRAVVRWYADPLRWHALYVAFQGTFVGHGATCYRAKAKGWSIPLRLADRLEGWIAAHCPDAAVDWPEREARLRAQAAAPAQLHS